MIPKLFFFNHKYFKPWPDSFSPKKYLPLKDLTLTAIFPIYVWLVPLPTAPPPKKTHLQVISSAGEVISVGATSTSDGTDGDDPIPIQAVR